MIKLCSIIKIAENRIQSAQKQLQKYYLKGWNLVGSSSYYLIVEKELDYDEAICLEEYSNAVQKEKNMAQVYVTKKNNLYGLIDEFGIEILPFCHEKCEYIETQQCPEHCPDIIFYKNDEMYFYNRCTSTLQKYQ